VFGPLAEPLALHQHRRRRERRTEMSSVSSLRTSAWYHRARSTKKRPRENPRSWAAALLQTRAPWRPRPLRPSSPRPRLHTIASLLGPADAARAGGPCSAARGRGDDAEGVRVAPLRSACGVRRPVHRDRGPERAGRASHVRLAVPVAGLMAGSGAGGRASRGTRNHPDGRGRRCVLVASRLRKGRPHGSSQHLVRPTRSARSRAAG
jgi:hypothetical protein